MNLIKIQDALNKLPPNQESIQYLTAAAQGGNIQVPPWLALTRIGEINKEIQSAQPAAQAPTEPLSESLPKQAMQSMGVMSLAPQMQQRPPMQQQQMPPQMQQRPPMQQQQMPPQMQQRPPMQQRPQGMAGGGLAGLHVDPRMFEYGSGGVVAFADGEQVVDQYIGKDGSETVTDEGGGGGEEVFDAAANLKRLQQQAATQMRQEVRPVRTTEEIQKSLNGTNKYGVTEGPIGQEYLQGLAALKAAKEADRGELQKDIDQKQRNAVAKALIAFGEGSRGQKGLGGIGAFGSSYMGSTENLMGEQAALRQNAIRTDELINEASYKVQELRRAQLKGDVTAEHNADIALARIARDLGVSKNRLLQAEITGNLNLLGRQAAAQATVEASGNRKDATLGAAAIKKEATLGAAGINKEGRLGAAGIGADAKRDVANARPKIAEVAAARTEQYNKKLQNTQDQAIIKDDTGTFTKEQKTQAAQRILNSRSGEAPAAASSTPPISKLKEGVATKFENGQTWTLKNGQPVQVK